MEIPEIPWLGFCAFTAEGADLNTDQGIKILWARQHSQKIKIEILFILHPVPVNSVSSVSSLRSNFYNEMFQLTSNSLL